jgi:hypothetical protein
MAAGPSNYESKAQLPSFDEEPAGFTPIGEPIDDDDLPF